MNKKLYDEYIEILNGINNILENLILPIDMIYQLQYQKEMLEIELAKINQQN